METPEEESSSLCNLGAPCTRATAPASGRGRDHIYQVSVTSQALPLLPGVHGQVTRQGGMLACLPVIPPLLETRRALWVVQTFSICCCRTSLCCWLRASLEDSSHSRYVFVPSLPPTYDDTIHHVAVWSVRLFVHPFIFSFVCLARMPDSSGQGCTYQTLNAHLSDECHLCFIKRKSLACGGKPFGQVF